MYIIDDDRKCIIMCGRFTLFSSEQEIANTFGVMNEFSVGKRFNIAPSQQILGIIQDGDSRRAGQLTWGLIPPWAKDKRIGSKMINARGETLAEKPSFKRAFQSRRCIIPTNGFYEWKKTANGKQPYFIFMKDEPIFAFAGIWEKWIDPQSSEAIFSCTVITTDANETIQPLHHRMPVILNKEAQQIWLNNEAFPQQQLQSLIQPNAADKITTYPVSTFVNSAKNEGQQCMVEVSQE